MSTLNYPHLEARQATRLIADLRVAFTPIAGLFVPLQVGTVNTETLKRLNSAYVSPHPIYLYPGGVWHATVRGLGLQGVLSDTELLEFVHPFEATHNLIEAVRQVFAQFDYFLARLSAQPNAGHLVGRCIREKTTRTVWMSQTSDARFPSEQELNTLLDDTAATAEQKL